MLKSEEGTAQYSTAKSIVETVNYLSAKWITIVPGSRSSARMWASLFRGDMTEYFAGFLETFRIRVRWLYGIMGDGSLDDRGP